MLKRSGLDTAEGGTGDVFADLVFPGFTLVPGCQQAQLAPQSGRNSTFSRRPSASASRSSIGMVSIVPPVSNRAAAGCWSPHRSPQFEAEPRRLVCVTRARRAHDLGPLFAPRTPLAHESLLLTRRMRLG